MDSKQAASNGIGFGGALFLLFLGLKLCGVIGWSWWWVTAPLWMPVAIVITVLLVFFLLAWAGTGRITIKKRR